MSTIYRSARLALILSLLPFFLLDRAVGKEGTANKRRVVRPRGLEYCIVRDLICSHKHYLRPSYVAKRLSEDGMLNFEMWGDKGRITQRTFRECFGTLKKHEAILAALRVEGAANADIQKLSELSNLKELVLEECQADDLSPLLKLKKLETLCIHRPNMDQLRDEKLLQKMGRLRNVQLISVPSLQEAIDLPLPPAATRSDEGYSDEGLRSIRIHTPIWDGKPITIPEHLKHLVLSFACGQKGYVCLSQAGIEIRARPESSQEVSDGLRKLVYHSGLMEIRAIADKTRLRINAMRSETEEGQLLPSNMVAIELNQPNMVNAKPFVIPGVYRLDRLDYAYWLGAQGNRTKASEITGKYDPKKTKDPDIGLFIWSDSDKSELTGRREYRRHGARLNCGRQITIRVEEKDGKLHARALPKGNR